MDNNTTTAKGEAREESRKTKVFAISIAVILILFSIAAIAIQPSLKLSKESEDLRLAKGEYDRAIENLHNAIDTYATKEGYNLADYDEEVVQSVYDGCFQELPTNARNLDVNSPDVSAEQIRNAANTIDSSISYYYTCRAVGDILDSPEVRFGLNPNTIFNIEEASTLNGNIADHVYGNRKSAVRIVEYADLQCPACASLQPYMDELREEYADEVAFVFRNYPIGGHQNAYSAARAAEAAGKIDNEHYWIMLSNLFERRLEWATQEEPFETYLQIYKDSFPGETTDKFERYYDDNDLVVKITHDAATGEAVELRGTPSIYINGELLDSSNIYTLDQYKEAIREEIESIIRPSSTKFDSDKTSN